MKSIEEAEKKKEIERGFVTKFKFVSMFVTVSQLALFLVKEKRTF